MCAAPLELKTFRSPTNQEKLLSSFKQRNLDEFKEIIKCKHVDVDYFYGDPDNGTLLDLACQSNGASEYVLILLLNGASITLWNKEELIEVFEKNTDRTTINYLRVAVILSEVKQGEEDEFDDTQIRTTVEKNDINTMRLIAYYCSEKLVPKLALSLLLHQGIDGVRALIEYIDVDKAFPREWNGHRAHTYRDIILLEYPKLKSELPTLSPSELPWILYLYLVSNAPELFLNLIADLSTEFLNSSFTSHDITYLHVACEKNYVDVVDALLEKHVQLNTLSSDFLFGIPHGQLTPLAIAAFMGHYEIVTKLITHNAHLQINGMGSALTFVIRGMNHEKISKDTHREILKLLLKYNSETVPALDINHKDDLEMTPIYLAIASNNEFAIKSLLYAGADLYSEDCFGGIALSLIPPTILENYFDDCINLEKTRSTIDFLQSVTFDYSIFKRVDHNSSTIGNEMEFFYLIEQKPELRTLLKHPLSESFLHVKWCLIKKYYYLNFAFYLSFYVALNIYIFQIQDYPSSSGINHIASILRRVSQLGLVIITSLLYIAFILRELCQFVISMKTYLRSLENWLEMMIILGVGAFFVFKPNADIAATVNLLLCLELVLLLGKHPWWSIYIQMFQKVVYNFAKFFALFSILAISFANSFYILFRDRTEEYTSSKNKTDADPSNQRIENSINSWADWRLSLIKSIIMMTGELDASNLPLGENFNYSYVFLLLFIFLVPMVLYNLLNGLAVSDTNAIMKDSEIFAVMSRVNLIWQLERLANSKLLQYIFMCCPGCLNHRLFTDVDYKKLTVHSNANYCIIQFDDFGGKIGKMPLTIIKQAEQIVEKRYRSNSAKNMDQTLWADVVKRTSSNSKSIDKAVHKFSDQMRSFKLEISKEIADRDEKLLQSVDERNAKLLESVMQAVAHLNQREYRSYEM